MLYSACPTENIRFGEGIGTMRLFIAILLSEEVQDGLCDAMRDLRPRFRNGSFTPRENLHLTLSFLGETAPERLDAVREAMEAVDVPPFRLRIDGIGSFPRRDGDIYWAGIERSDTLMRLQKELDAALTLRGFPMERRRFRPHLTLARRAVLISGEPEAFTLSALEMNVKKISLMCSIPGDTGRIYTELSAKELK